MSTTPVDRLADGGVALRHLEQTLGVAETQQVAGALQVRYAAEQLALGILIEVDHDVPAEDDIQWSLHRQAVHEIELSESDERGELGDHLITGTLATAPLHEKT